MAASCAPKYDIYPTNAKQNLEGNIPTQMQIQSLSCQTLQYIYLSKKINMLKI